MNIFFTGLKAGGTYAKKEYREGFMCTSILQCLRHKALQQCPNPPRKASSRVWRALQLQVNMHYKAAALEWLSWMSSSEREKERLQGPVTTERTALNLPPTVSHTVIWNGCVCRHLPESVFLLQSVFVCLCEMSFITWAYSTNTNEGSEEQKSVCFA